MLEVLVVLLTAQLDMLACLEMLGVGGPRWVHRYYSYMQAMLYRTEEHSTKGLALIFNKEEHLSTKLSTSPKTK